jgi:lipopolysaccharide export LptBFGC system permease protein LptF
VSKAKIHDIAINSENDEKIMNDINKNGNISEVLFNQQPIYNRDSNIEEMQNNNKNFYEQTSKRAFSTIFNEEENKLRELVDNTYYPDDNREEELTDIELVKKYINLII